MSNTQPTTEPQDSTDETEQTPAGQETPTDKDKTEQPDTDWQAEAEKWKSLSRKHEDASKANADKARQFDEWQQSQKSEQQKADEAAQQLQAERDEALREAALARAALTHGLTADDLELIGGGTAEEIDAKAQKLAERLKAGQQARPHTPDPRLGQEQKPAGSGDWLRDQLQKN